MRFTAGVQSTKSKYLMCLPCGLLWYLIAIKYISQTFIKEENKDDSKKTEEQNGILFYKNKNMLVFKCVTYILLNPVRTNRECW